MWWNTKKFEHVWSEFEKQGLATMQKKYHGDQDFITDAILVPDRRLFDTSRIKSWRWQAFDGGYDFTGKTHRVPAAGTQIQRDTSVLIFHGHPKPDKISDDIIVQNWQ
jgi:hypothetical protein